MTPDDRRSLGGLQDLGDGRFRVSISAGYDKATGKRHRPSRTVRGTERDAEHELNTMLMRSGKLSPRKLTLTEFMEQVWLPTKQSRRKRTYLGYASKIRTCITPYIGNLPLKSVDAYVVERWLIDLENDGMSPQTVIHARSVLKNAMRAAARWRHVDGDPTVGTEKPKVDYRPAILTDEQANDYLDAFAGHIVEPIVVLEIAGGLRRSEAAAVDWSDVDFDAGTVSISRGLHQYGGEVWFEEPKSKTSRRTIALPTRAMETLRALRAVGPLVPDGEGRMSPEKIARLYDEHITEKGLPRVTLRELRNSHGTMLRRHGVPISAIAERLGHGDERVTTEHYIVRESLPVDTVAVTALESVFACQNAPNIRAKHGRKVTESQDGSTERRTASQ